ncbi:MAG: signal peptide peptidase SppA [Velocimicrobium sp.]
MKNKQILGLVIAGVIFITAGISSVFSEKLVAQMFSGKGSGSMSTEMASIFGEGMTSIDLPNENFIGIVRVEGTIQDAGSSSAFSTVSYDHQNTLKYIDKLIDSNSNRGILLCVNSPGGTVYHSDELYLKLMEYKEKTGRPIWAYMETQACSGGFYVSMAADKVAANRNAWTGSIGVIISYYNYSDLFDDLGIEEIDITSGVNKAMGSSGKKLTKEQRAIMQGLVDESYEQFVGIVAKGRNMSVDKVKELADGRLYTAKQAKENGLIDEVSAYDEFELAFRKEVGGGSIVYEPSFTSETLLSSIFTAYKGATSKSDAQVLSEFLEKEGNGVPLYYAGNK